MDAVAIDIGTRYVGLCKWDGRSLLIRKLPAAAPEQGWAAWIEALRPAGRYTVLLRWPVEEMAQSLSADAVAELARVHGASDVRVLTNDTSADPSLAAARHTANTEHLGRIMVVEAGASWTTLGIVEPDGRVRVHGRLRWAPRTSNVGFLGTFLRSFLHAKGGVPDEERSELPLGCGGGAGPSVAAALAETCGLRTVLIPPHAGAMATVGMLLADIVIRLEEPLGPMPLEIAALRRAFGRLMDRASDAITREGYDLDDAVCERSALMGPADSDLLVQVDCDNLADASRLLSRFRSAVARQGWHGLAQPGRGVDEAAAPHLRAGRLKATIHTRKPDFPIAPAPSHALDAAILRHPPADAIIPAGAIVYSREALPANVDLPGPAAICESFTTTVVPTGWTARRTLAGGLMLRQV